MLCATLAAAQETKPPIEIGVVLELTGRLANYGEAGKRGIDMAADAFGDTKIGGRNVKFVYRDVQSEPQLVISAINDLTNSEHVNYIIGPCASPLVSAAVPAWRQTKPVWMEFCGTSPRLQEAVGAEANFFHTFPYSYHYHKAEAGALRQYLGPGKRAVVIYSDDELGRGHIEAIEKYYQDAGIKIIGTEVARVGTTDFNPVLTKLGRANPDILVAMVQGGDLSTLTKQIYARRFAAPYRVSTGAVQFDTFVKAVGNDAQEGWIGPSTYVPGIDRPADPQYPKLFPSSREWNDRFVKRYGREPDLLDVGSYVSAAMLLIALQHAGTDNREKVAIELAKLDVMTPLGRGHFVDSDGTKHQAFTDMMVFQRQGGRPVVVFPPEVATRKLQPAQIAP
ncbi:ABC transporter substrate-binding protein [Paraburkholderia aromaticivorans]|uniref:ABC transporter substrate-binding protein n=1 Tax=Paraburkholderia aromaticivorans TaxID=2026199 RepID=UPI0014560BD5|nr:ABC transporter substrate-binding protein [Paraburkholderia aromaticivorans]